MHHCALLILQPTGNIATHVSHSLYLRWSDIFVQCQPGGNLLLSIRQQKVGRESASSILVKAQGKWEENTG